MIQAFMIKAGHVRTIGRLLFALLKNGGQLVENVIHTGFALSVNEPMIAWSLLSPKIADKKNLPLLAQGEARVQAESYEESPLAITTPGGSYKFREKSNVQRDGDDKLLNMDVAANNTVEAKNRPETKLHTPVINNEPTNTSLLKSFMLISVPFALGQLLLRFRFSWLLLYTTKKSLQLGYY